MDGALLACRDLCAGYGPVVVTRDVNMHVGPGEVVALLGPNGAGKTTTLLTVAGELPPISGEVLIDGMPTRTPLHRRARRGLAFVSEERSVFMRLSGNANLRVGGVSSRAAAELFPELDPLLRRPAGLLSGGEQQMLTLARAFGRKPRLLLVDELSLGLAPLIVERLLSRIREIATAENIGVILVEQHVHRALAIADRAYVMQRGEVVLEGTADEIRSRVDALEQAYLTRAEPARNGEAV
jgi:branched-chain amino acid transport system ATP-binding protein